MSHEKMRELEREVDEGSAGYQFGWKSILSSIGGGLLVSAAFLGNELGLFDNYLSKGNYEKPSVESVVDYTGTLDYSL